MTTTEDSIGWLPAPTNAPGHAGSVAGLMIGAFANSRHWALAAVHVNAQISVRKRQEQ